MNRHLLQAVRNLEDARDTYKWKLRGLIWSVFLWASLVGIAVTSTVWLFVAGSFDATVSTLAFLSVTASCFATLLVMYVFPTWREAHRDLVAARRAHEDLLDAGLVR